MTPDQQEDVRKLLARYDDAGHRDTQIACGDKAIEYLRIQLMEAQQPDPRAGRRIAPVEVYTILNRALKQDLLIDRLSPLATEIANLSRLHSTVTPTQ